MGRTAQRFCNVCFLNDHAVGTVLRVCAFLGHLSSAAWSVFLCASLGTAALCHRRRLALCCMRPAPHAGTSPLADTSAVSIFVLAVCACASPQDRPRGVEWSEQRERRRGPGRPDRRKLSPQGWGRTQILEQEMLLAFLSLKKLQAFRSSVPGTGVETDTLLSVIAHFILPTVLVSYNKLLQTQ